MKVNHTSLFQILTNSNAQKLYSIYLTLSCTNYEKPSLPPLYIHQNACLDEYNNSRPKNVFQFFSTFFVILQVHAMVNSLKCVSF